MDGNSTTNNACGGEEENLSYVPRIGMTFDSEEEAHNFYNTYGQIVGFSTRIHYSKTEKTTDGEIILSRTYVCSKEGYRKEDKRDHLVKNPTSEIRTGCGVLLRVRLNKDTGKYTIYGFVPTHNNHSLLVNVLSHMLPSHRRISQVQATQIELAADSGINLRSAHELMAKESGGRECIGFVKSDHKNYLRTRGQKMLSFGEVGIISNYFLEKRQENPSFYHDVQLDSEEKIANIFWADAYMISDYHSFGDGDSVSFDTTYKINNENHPFAIFVGFNNHRERVVFGASLMYDETADSFIWLFQTFLKAMSNKHPKTIFTDQDVAMAKAISFVLPNTYHRLCKWHMMQNALKHVSAIFKGSHRVRGVLAPFFDDYEEETEFFNAWEALLAGYSLHNNSWLRGIFDLRRKWGRPYVRWSWSAGMKSTQLSESLNSTLKLYLKSNYNLGQFFTHFDRALDNIRFKEREVAFSLAYKLPRLKMKSIQMLVQAGEVYTTTIFEEFQEEYESSIQLHVTERRIQNGCSLYTLTSPLLCKPRQVMKGEHDILYCDCRLFEMRGVVCMHIIKVLRDELCLLELPDHYILKRWTKKARAEVVKYWSGREVDVDPKLARNTRFKELATALIKLAGRASETEHTTNVLLQAAKEASQTIEELLHSFISHQEVQSNQKEVEIGCSDTLDHAKGLKKKPFSGSRTKRRIIGSLENALASRKRKTIPKEKPAFSRLPKISHERRTTYRQESNLAEGIQMTQDVQQHNSLHVPWIADFPVNGPDFYDGDSCVQQLQDSSLMNQRNQKSALSCLPDVSHQRCIPYTCRRESHLSEGIQMTQDVEQHTSLHVSGNAHCLVGGPDFCDGNSCTQLLHDSSATSQRNAFDLNRDFNDLERM